jgi:hypothetical protein
MMSGEYALQMKHKTLLGSRIAEVHNGSSLFTGDAGQGRAISAGWIIENDWLEAIIALPLTMFYNTGIGHLHLGYNQSQAGAPAGPSAVDRCHTMVQAP